MTRPVLRQNACAPACCSKQEGGSSECRSSALRYTDCTRRSPNAGVAPRVDPTVFSNGRPCSNQLPRTAVPVPVATCASGRRSATSAGRLRVRTEKDYHALRTARQRETTDEFKEGYAKRTAPAGVRSIDVLRVAHNVFRPYQARTQTDGRHSVLRQLYSHVPHELVVRCPGRSGRGTPHELLRGPVRGRHNVRGVHCVLPEAGRSRHELARSRSTETRPRSTRTAISRPEIRPIRAGVCSSRAAIAPCPR